MNSYSLQKGFSWVHGLFLAVVLVVLMGLMQPMILVKAKAGDRTKALANAKSVTGALLAFKADNGAFPCDATRGELAKEGFTNLPTGDSSNAYLTQLLTADAIDTTGPFAVAGTQFTKQNRWSKNDLAEGTNGFAYLMAPNGAPLTDTRSFTPLILAGIVAQGSEPVFDKKVFGGKFVMGLVDGSSTAGDLDENGHAVSEARESFFQTGPDSLFGKDTPVLKYPLGLE
ncbi:MAG: hypothetical protein P1U90_11290 [Akkermansiaceae bacterium]|nr:hypothetical protein [Akkermansiaceae bacterium]